MSRIPVLQIVDTLEPGGYERLAVNLANALPRDRYVPSLCVTRAGGPLEADLVSDVERLALGRRRTFDPAALLRLVSFVRSRGVRILHPHGPSLFLARVAALFPPYPAVVWHAHFGRVAAQDRRAWPYRLAVLGIGGVIGVNQTLVDWARRRLGIAASRSWYLPNIAGDAGAAAPAPDLPGAAGRRILCVGNLRPEKDHGTLLRAVALAVRQVPGAHLLLAGAPVAQDYTRALHDTVRELGLEHHVTFLGRRTDSAALMRACDIGVLSSRFEGLPMSLLEYGMASLPVVSTAVGQCGEVLEDGRCGILVPPGDAAQLGAGLLALLGSAALRAAYADRFHRRVVSGYSAAAVMGRLSSIYETVLAGRHTAREQQPVRAGAIE